MRRSSRLLTGVAALLTAVFFWIAPALASERPSLQQQIEHANELMRAGKPGEALTVVDAALAQAEAEGNPGALAAVLMMRMGLQTVQRDFPAAETSAKRAFEQAEKLASPGLPIRALIAMNATMLYLQWGRPALAEPWAKRAIADAEKADRNGRLHEAMVGFLAIVEEATGKYAAAQQHREQELAIAEKRSKRDLAGEAASLMRLGDLRGKRGDVPGAQSAYAGALERELTRGDAERSAADFARLARLHRALGHDANAQAALERANAAAGAAGDVAPMAPSTSQQELAKRHIASATVFAWRDIGRVERDRGRAAEAEAAFRRALVLSERMDGPGNPNLPAMQIELGDLLRSRAAWADAEAVYANALAALGQTAGGTADDMPEALEGMARVLLAKGEHARAEAAVRREIALYEAYIASDHPQLASALELLAEILVASGRGDETMPVLARAAAIWEIKR